MTDASVYEIDPTQGVTPRAYLATRISSITVLQYNKRYGTKDGSYVRE